MAYGKHLDVKANRPFSSDPVGMIPVRFSIEYLGIITSPEHAPLIKAEIVRAYAPGRRTVEKFI